MNQKILLLLQPSFSFNYHYEYLSLPLLKGQLIHAGYNTETIDLCEKFLNFVVNENTLLGNLKKTKLLYNEHNSKINSDFVKNYVGSEETFKKSVQEIYNLSHNKNYNDIIDIKDQMKIFLYYNLPYQKNVRLNSKDILQAVENVQFNPFYDFLHNEIHKLSSSYKLILVSNFPFGNELTSLFTLLKILKIKYPSTPIALGGGHITRIKNELIKHDEFFNKFYDYLMVSDGEKSVVELTDYIFNKKSIEDISNIIYKHDDKIIQNQIRCVDINEVYPACYSSIPKEISIMMSKGCYYNKCKFCDFSFSYESYKLKTIEKVVNEIKYFSKRGVKEFHFVDDSIPPLYLKLFAEKLIQEDLEIKYDISAIFDKNFNNSIFKLLHKSGCRKISWGFETGSLRLFKLINKSGDYSKRSKILKASSKNKIKNHLNLMYDLPTENNQDIKETFKFILKNINFIDEFALSKFVLLKNAFMAQNYKDFNIELNEQETEEFSSEIKIKQQKGCLSDILPIKTFNILLYEFPQTKQKLISFLKFYIKNL